MPAARRVGDGQPTLPALGADLDIRSEPPRVGVDGELVASPADLRSACRDDLVSFLIRCLFSFEDALIENDTPLGHVFCGCSVPTYWTSVVTAPAGRLHPADGGADTSAEVRRRDPRRSGDDAPAVSAWAPVHIGFPEAIGIAHPGKPDYGDAVAVEPDELPVFWACGVNSATSHRGGTAAARDHPCAGCI